MELASGIDDTYGGSILTQNEHYLSLEELYQRYTPPAFSLALKILQNPQAAEDAVQEAFIRVWQHLDTYNPLRSQFLTWLLRIVHNQCIDQLRRKKHLQLVPLEPNGIEAYFSNFADARPEPAEVVWVEQKRQAIRRSLLGLPARQRELIELAFFGGYTHTQLAARTGLPVGTVKSTIRQGMLRLSKMREILELNKVD